MSEVLKKPGPSGVTGFHFDCPIQFGWVSDDFMSKQRDQIRIDNHCYWAVFFGGRLRVCEFDGFIGNLDRECLEVFVVRVFSFRNRLKTQLVSGVMVEIGRASPFTVL